VISTASSAVATRAASPTTTPSAWAPAGRRFPPAPGDAPPWAVGSRSANSSTAAWWCSIRSGASPRCRRPARPSSCGRARRLAPRDRSAPPGEAIRTGAALSLPPEIDPSDTARRPSVLCHAGAHASLAHHLFTSPPRPRGDGPEGMTFSRNS